MIIQFEEWTHNKIESTFDVSAMKTESTKKPDKELSVIIPVFNEAKIIERSLKSLLKLDYPNYEKIIVNHDCTDRFTPVISGFTIPSVESTYIRWVGKTKNSTAEHGHKRFVQMNDIEVLLRQHLFLVMVLTGVILMIYYAKLQKDPDWLLKIRVLRK